MAPDLTYTLIRPLEEKYVNLQRKGNYSIVFCFLLNRVHFLRDQGLVSSPLSVSRASVCEILAARTLRQYGDNTLELAFVMTTNWPVYSGADEQMLKTTMDYLNVDDVEERVGNAIEMAIIGKAKRFIKSSACQRVIDSIWRYAHPKQMIVMNKIKCRIISVENVSFRRRIVTRYFQM